MAEKQHAVDSKPAKSALFDIGGAFANALGFQSTGIAAESVAARIMAAHGGSVPARSLCASLQSMGASRSPAGHGVTAAGPLTPSCNGAEIPSGAAASSSGQVRGAALSVVHGSSVVGGRGAKSASGPVGKAANVSERAHPQAHTAQRVGSGGPSHAYVHRSSHIPSGSAQGLGGGSGARSHGSTSAARGTGPVARSRAHQSSHSRSAALSCSFGNTRK